LVILLGQATGNARHELILQGASGTWELITVIAIAALVFILAVINYRNLHPLRRRVGLLTLRLLSLSLLVLLFLQPALMEEEFARSRSQLAVVIDTSMSMSLQHGKHARIDHAKDFLRKNKVYFDRLRIDVEPIFFTVGTSLESKAELNNTERQGLTGTAPQTRLIEGLRELDAATHNRELAGVVVVTDGADTDTSGALTTDQKRIIRKLDSPIFPVLLPEQVAIKDIAITSVSINSFAFLMNRAQLEARIDISGFNRGRFNVQLLEDGQLIGEKFVEHEQPHSNTNVSFDFVPRQLGQRVYTVRIAPQKDEVLTENNRIQSIVNVVRDKIRILQIVGQPSWDERFLRNHLKQNPNIDLISFFILVNTGSFRPLQAGDTVLIPFPAHELFEEELGGFDLVIFQNFNYGPFRTRQYLPHITRYVREGGAFVMVGGARSFSAGGYWRTPITAVLPVELPHGPQVSFFGATPKGAEQVLDYKRFLPRLTDAGIHHPVTRLALDPVTNQAKWKALNALEGLNLVDRTKPGALVLVEHPNLKDKDGKPMPVVAVQQADKGRVMVVTTDTTWKWVFEAGIEGKDHRLYDRFWSNAIRWLIKDPELDLLRVSIPDPSVAVGKSVHIHIELVRGDYRPAANQPVQVIIRRRDEAGGLRQSQIVARFTDKKTDGEGNLKLEYPVTKTGIYEVEATSNIIASRLVRGSNLFVGTKRNVEFLNVVPNSDLMASVADVSGGKVLTMDTVLRNLPLKPPRIMKVTDRKYEELWNDPLVFILVLLLITSEWWLRRRYGYL
jgi:uncharacterized membrane protein